MSYPFLVTPALPPRLSRKIRRTISLLLPRVTDRKFTPLLVSLLGLIVPLTGGGGGGGRDVALDQEKLLIRL